MKKLINVFVTLFFAISIFGTFALPAQAIEGDDPLGLTVGEATGLSADVDVRVSIAKIIKMLLGLLGLIAVIIIIYAGFVWMTSAGNDEKISKAKKTLFAAVIGLAIIMSAYIITSFVIENLYYATTEYTYPR